MDTRNGIGRARVWPLAIAVFALFGSIVAALVIIWPPYLGDPGPNYAAPQPTLLQYGLAVACVITPLVAILVLLLKPERPWLTIAVMLATGFGLIDIVIGVVAIMLAILVIQAELQGTFPYFW